MSHTGGGLIEPEETVLGIDGCRGGWIVVSLKGRTIDAEFTDNLAPLIDQLRAGTVAAMAIDMPIGLLNDRPRACDIEARKILGPRKSSVFPAPVRATLAADDYQHACTLSREASGKALSKQAFNLLPKIAELDALVQPQDQDRLVEAHPECAFVRLAGHPLDEPKRTPAGRMFRQELLAKHDTLLGGLVDAHPGLPALDLIDAASLVVTACHVVRGTERRLGDDRDATGLQATVVY